MLHNEDYGQSGGLHIRFTSLSFIDIKTVPFFAFNVNTCIEMYITHIYKMFILIIAKTFLQFLNLIITLGINSQIESKAVKAHMLLCKHSFPLNPVSRHLPQTIYWCKREVK